MNTAPTFVVTVCACAGPRGRGQIASWRRLTKRVAKQDVVLKDWTAAAVVVGNLGGAVTLAI